MWILEYQAVLEGLSEEGCNFGFCGVGEGQVDDTLEALEVDVVPAGNGIGSELILEDEVSILSLLAVHLEEHPKYEGPINDVDALIEYLLERFIS